MILPTSKENNRANLVYVSDKLKSIDNFVFFGTLLGLHREGDIIGHDDDVDFFINIADRDLLVNLLKDSELIIDLDLNVNKSLYFMQGYRVLNGEKTFVDFYFFEMNAGNCFIVQRWGFSGAWRKKFNHMHIPLSFIFPIQHKTYFDQTIKLPADSESCCKYLYGATWMTPLKKKQQYRILILNNNPKIFIGIFGRLFYESIRLNRKLFKL